MKTEILPTHSTGDQPQVRPWSPAVLLAFRFAFVYCVLYSVLSHVLVHLFLPPGTMPGQGLGTLEPLYRFTSWVAVQVFEITSPLVYMGNSRDTEFFWVQAFLILSVASALTVIWSVLDRRRRNYVVLHKWFRLFIRFAVAAQMLYFGMVKVIPTQFPAPSLITLIAPVGNMSLQGLLWTTTGASTPYQVITGIVEVSAGLLLLLPRTTLLGAVVCLLSMAHVFILNMTYDVGVKILSFHLILMSVVLIAPDLRRLINIFLLNRLAGASAEPDLFRTARANRIARAAQIALGLYLLAMYTQLSRTFWYADGGGGSPKSALYGIWDVEELAIDGEVRPAERNDYDRRWRRVIFDAPYWIYFQRTNDSIVRYGATIDSARKSLSLTKGGSRTWRSDFTFERPAEDRLLIDGQMDGYRVQMSLQRVELDTFRLLNSHFRWARPPDPGTE